MALITLTIRTGTSLSALTREVGTAIIAARTVASNCSRDGSEASALMDTKSITEPFNTPTLISSLSCGFGKIGQNFRRSDRIIIADRHRAGSFEVFSN